MSRREAKAPSQRQLRVGEEIRHAIAWALERGDVHDPEVQDVLVTVTEVRISPDLRNATAFVVPLGGGAEGDLKKVLGGLNRAVPFLRKVIAKSVHLRTVPRLNFIADTSFDEASHIDQLLRDPVVARDLANRGDAEEDGNEDEDGA